MRYAGRFEMLSVQQRTPADLARLIEADKEEIAAVIRFLFDKGEIKWRMVCFKQKILLLQITKNNQTWPVSLNHSFGKQRLEEAKTKKREEN